MRWQLEFDFADLDGGLGVGEVGDVGDELGNVRTERFLERFERVEVEVADGEIRRGCVWHHAGEALIDGGLTESGANELVDERNVFFAVVGHIEVIAGMIGIHDADFDHEASWSEEDASRF